MNSMEENKKNISDEDEINVSLDDSSEDFSYKNLNTKYYENPSHDKAKIMFDFNNIEYAVTANTPKYFFNFGQTYKILEEDKVAETQILEWKLKFHISLPEQEKKFSWYPFGTINSNEKISNNKKINAYEKGWNIVKRILIDNQVASFKVICAGKKMSEIEGQAGKDITIYAYQNPDKTIKDWEKIIQEITEKLVNAGINPGYKVEDNKNKFELAIKGSQYVYYRYENNKKYKKDEDPCEKIEINVNNQVEAICFKQENNNNNATSENNEDNQVDEDNINSNNTGCCKLF